MISDVTAFWLLVCGRRAYFNMLNLKSKLKNEFSEWKINMNEDYFIWLAKVFTYTNHAFNFLQIIKFDMWPAAGKRTISDFSIWCMRSHAHMPPQVQLVRCVQKIARNTSVYDNYFWAIRVKEMKEISKTSYWMVDHFSLTFVNLSLA